MLKTSSFSQLMSEEEFKMVHRRSFWTVFVPLMLSQVTLCFSIKYVIPRGSLATFSCSSNVSPVWNSVKDSHHVQSLAIGDQRMTRFKDERYENFFHLCQRHKFDPTSNKYKLIQSFYLRFTNIRISLILIF